MALCALTRLKSSEKRRGISTGVVFLIGAASCISVEQAKRRVYQDEGMAWDMLRWLQGTQGSRMI
jgi:hypothetical protein